MGSKIDSQKKKKSKGSSKITKTSIKKRKSSKQTSKAVAKLIDMSLLEDLGNNYVDITTEATMPKTKKAKAQIRVKDFCIACGLNVAEEIIKSYEKKTKAKAQVKFNILRKDGSFVQKNEVIAELEGPARTILSTERTVLNFVSRLTGIATLTNRFVQKILLHKVKLLDTRKTTGGYRELEKYAVLTGGGNNHRIGLYDMYLIKDNHIIVAGSIKKAIEKVIAARKTKKVSIEVEVDSLKQLDEVLSLKKLPDWIMLDNLSYEEMEIGVERIRKKSKKIKIEASGGVCLENISEIAKCKVDFISVGTALTLGAKPTDVGMDIIM